MRRALFPPLAAACTAALSCAVLQPAARPLPPVDAPPPAASVAAAGPIVEDEDPDVALVRQVLASRRTGLAEFEVERLARTVVREARRNDFDPRLILAVMAVESGYDTFAVSHVGAMGLMQILPSTGMELAAQAGVPWHGMQTLFDPFVNVQLGVRYLRQLTDRFGRLSTALAAYNWGPGHIHRRLRRGTPLPERYARLVLDRYDEARSGT